MAPIISADSSAALPAPMVAVTLPRKSGPSQTVHEVMPLPFSSFSPGTPNSRGWMPLAISTVLCDYHMGVTCLRRPAILFNRHHLLPLVNGHVVGFHVVGKVL